MRFAPRRSRFNIAGMKRLTFLLAVIGLVCTGCQHASNGVVAAQSNEARQHVQPFRFVHVSDTHFGTGNNQPANIKMFEEISALDPPAEFLVNTGDIAEIGTDEEYAELQDALKSLKPRMYLAPGNHDVRWNPRGKSGYVDGVGQELFQSWTHNGVHFVTLDSTVLLQHWGHISQEQLDWLKSDLDKLPEGTPVVIGFHHWIGRDRVMVDNEQKLMDAVEPYNVVLWLQGHGHSDIQWSINGTAAIMQKGLYQGSYTVIDVEPDQMTLKRRALVDPKRRRANELVRDKDVPATEEFDWTELMTIPLVKQPAPKWAADAKAESAGVRVVAQRGDLPDDAKLGVRINNGSYEPMESSGDAWNATLPADRFIPGEQLITVQATLADGRAYQKPMMVTIDGPIKPAWETNVGGAVQSRLVCEDGTLYVSTMGGDLVALDPNNGNEKWRLKTGGPVFSTPHLDNGVVYIGSEDGQVYAADADTGSVRWKTKTGGAVLGSAATAQGVVCIGSVDAKIYGLDQKTGEVLWTVPAENMTQTKAATDGENFFVGSWDNTFRCINAKTGAERWALRLGKRQRNWTFSAFSPAITSPTVGGRTVFVSTNDGILHAIDIPSGKEIWAIDWERMGYSSPLFHDGRVYAALDDKGRTFCVKADTGEFVWQTDTGSVIYDSSFAYGGGNVYIGCVEGIFNAINAVDGKMMWQYRLGPGHVLASPATDEQHVFISSMSGKVTALPHGR